MGHSIVGERGHRAFIGIPGLVCVLRCLLVIHHLRDEKKKGNFTGEGVCFAEGSGISSQPGASRCQGIVCVTALFLTLQWNEQVKKQEIRSMLADVDKEGGATVSYNEFVEMVTPKVLARDPKVNGPHYHVVEDDRRHRSLRT